ncbi:hypothetical protein F442_11961 [Phytophthora nicotianae P10297]|uniref:Uncharacterized protein n=1 Tax=Phytophthora nicotianae P10297 TaxID=1317064 RepID=W2Z0I8_PHYNI|nr:hypothetical protein F442_11961 [Phytophthora nicotianae P10297]
MLKILKLDDPVNLLNGNLKAWADYVLMVNPYGNWFAILERAYGGKKEMAKKLATLSEPNAVGNALFTEWVSGGIVGVKRVKTEVFKVNPHSALSNEMEAFLDQ